MAGFATAKAIARNFGAAGGFISHNKFVLPERAANCTGTPLSIYGELLRKNILKEDASQERTLRDLTFLFDDVRKGSTEMKGMYIYGPPGSGKSMSMDLFHYCLVTHADFSNVKTKRLHFHEFMHDTHRRMHTFYDRMRKATNRKPGKHVVQCIADRISSEVDILCFDEMNVTTVQDCAILSPLFQRLFTNGVVCVMTSNRQPEDLYTDGLNRHIFLPPLLDKVHRFCKVVSVDSNCDYRVLRMAEETGPRDQVFHWPSSDGGDSFLDQWIATLSDGKTTEKQTIEVAYGRNMEVNVLNDSVAVFDFNALCGREKSKKNYSVDDYFALTQKLPIFVVRNVPELHVENHNEARRWTNFIDACYENKCRLILTLHCHPNDVLKHLMPLTDITMDKVGAGYVGSGDFDSANSSSAVVAAVDSMKAAIQRERDSPDKAPEKRAKIEVPADIAALSLSRFDPAKDQEIWRQRATRAHPNPLPQVSRSWDRRRRSAAFAWEGADPTAEQETVKGVFKAAVASLQESGFSALRMASRLQEMQTRDYQVACMAKRKEGST